jgi:hypothetical protein
VVPVEGRVDIQYDYVRSTASNRPTRTLDCLGHEAGWIAISILLPPAWPVGTDQLILRGSVNYFTIGPARRRCSYVRDWVEMKK